MKKQNLEESDPLRWQTLLGYLDEARKKIPQAIQHAYCIVVTVSEKNEIQAFRIAVGDEPLFHQIKADSRSRIQDTPISAEALLPGGPYDLWREGETTRRVKDLVGAFAQFPHLPKMLNRKAILDTLVNGCLEGTYVLRFQRPDRSVKTFWREPPDEFALKDPGLEAVLPEAAILTELSPALLKPGALPGLWEAPEIALRNLYEYFSGGRAVKIQREGYEEPVTIPKAEPEVIDAAVHRAVKEGKLWLTSGPASIWAEEIPAGILSEDARLQAPPSAISPLDLIPDKLPEAWSNGTTTALAISVALSKKVGKTLPWATVREAIDGAFRARLLERTIDSGPWPCSFAEVAAVKLRLLSQQVQPPVSAPLMPPKLGIRVGEAELRPNEIQDLADVIGDLVGVAVGHDLKFRVRIELGGDTPPPDEVVEKVNEILESVSENIRLH